MKKSMFTRCQETYVKKRKFQVKNGLALVLLVMLLFIGNSIAYGYAPWENDPFDNLSTGSLNGKNGWTGTPSAQIILDPAYGSSSYKILKIDPAAGQTITNSKFVTSNNGTIQSLDFLVRSDDFDPLQPSLAKLAIFASGVMKFQIYFGANIRINYSSNSDDKYYLVSSTESGRWYWIHIVMKVDGANNWYAYAYVDGDYIDPVSQDKTNDIQPGAITGLVLTGWDRPGLVYLDDIYGIRRY